jgi:predicted DNA-binding transcriptional regulator AlpA
MRDGDFPNSFKIGKNATAWIEEDIEVWIRKTVLESRIETEYFS